MIAGPDTELRAIMAARRRLLKVVAATLAATIVTAVVGAVAAARATAAGTTGAPAAGTGLIAFARLADDGTSSLYVVRADGTGLRRLSSGPTDSDPAWTPDGKRLVFASSRGGRARAAPDLYVRDLAGRNVVRLTRSPPNVGTVQPAVRLDGTGVVFVRQTYRGGRWTSDLHSVGLTGAQRGS